MSIFAWLAVLSAFFTIAVIGAIIGNAITMWAMTRAVERYKSDASTDQHPKT